jgi:hypothetical protein
VASDNRSVDLVRGCLSAIIAALLLGAVLILSGGVSTAPTVTVAAPVSLTPAATTPSSPVPVATPPAVTATSSSSTRPTTTSRRTTTSSGDDDVIADRCTNRIDYAADPRSNAEINSIGARTGRCPRPITAVTIDDPGEPALDACTEQTGMTREECLADAAAGNAN